MNDFATKLHRILFNYDQKNRKNPPINWLIRQSGKNIEELTGYLNELQSVGYLEWDGQSIESIELRQSPQQAQPKKNNGYGIGNSYFTEH